MSESEIGVQIFLIEYIWYMRKITPLFGIAFKQTCTCTNYRTRLHECLVFWSTVFTPAIARKLMFKTFIFSTKCGVFFVEMYYVNSFKDIIYKKKRKKGKSTIQMFWYCENVSRFVTTMAKIHTQKVYQLHMQNSKVC